MWQIECHKCDNGLIVVPGHVCVTGLVNGAVLPLVIDSGESRSLITMATVQQIGLNKTDLLPLKMFSRKFHSDVPIVGKLPVTLKTKNDEPITHHFLVVDSLPHYPFISATLGMDFLGGYKCQLVQDCNPAQLVGHRWKPNNKRHREMTWRVKVNGKQMKASIHTGMNASVMASELVQKLKLKKTIDGFEYQNHENQIVIETETVHLQINNVIRTDWFVISDKLKKDQLCLGMISLAGLSVIEFGSAEKTGPLNRIKRWFCC